jgi:NhaP-type Na+/H+ and K+/H+ antiporter
MMLSLDFLALPLLTASALLLLSLVAGLFSARLGFSFLLVFLVAGMLLGEDGPGGVAFEDFRLAFWVGNVALAVILLDGGLRTRYATFRTGLQPSLMLATVGVAVSAALTGVGAWLLMDLNWRLALLLGAIVGSTDAAAVFSLLQTSGVRLNERVASTLEIESGLNDPMAVFLTLTLTGLAMTPGPLSPTAGWEPLLSLLQQFGWGLVIGGGLGWALPDRDDPVAARQVYGDFEVPADTPMASLCQFYGWPPIEDEQLTVGEWFHRVCQHRPVEGDQLRWGPAELSVRRVHEGAIERVGIRIEEEGDGSAQAAPRRS